jgi:hypothetical protein
MCLMGPWCQLAWWCRAGVLLAGRRRGLSGRSGRGMGLRGPRGGWRGRGIEWLGGRGEGGFVNLSQRMAMVLGWCFFCFLFSIYPLIAVFAFAMFHAECLLVSKSIECRSQEVICTLGSSKHRSRLLSYTGAKVEFQRIGVQPIFSTSTALVNRLSSGSYGKPASSRAISLMNRPLGRTGSCLDILDAR